MTKSNSLSSSRLPHQGLRRFQRALMATCIAASAAAIALSISGTAVAADKIPANNVTKPKLVVVLVVDGLPQEQVQRYRDQFGQGGFRRLLDQGAWFSDSHQAHGVTVTAVGHAAVLTGAYPYQHGIIGNEWIDRASMSSMYCTQDAAYTYLNEETKSSDGTSPANLRVSTLGDELRYSNGNLSKVVTVSGKDRGAILLAGKTGTAYMYMGKSGNFATSTYYQKENPEWVKTFSAAKPQDRFYGKQWKPLLPAPAYANDAPDNSPGMAAVVDNRSGFPFIYGSDSGQPDANYYGKLPYSPYLDELTLDFARAAIDGEKLGRNPAGVPDVLGISLSSHDYINHSFGPESRMSHDHLQRLDRLLASFFDDVEKRVGLENTLIVLTADHGFPNVPEFSQSQKRDAQRLNTAKLMSDVNDHLSEKFGLKNLVLKFSFPSLMLDYPSIDQKGLKREDVESAIARFLSNYPGVANTYTRTQLSNGNLPDSRQAKLMQRGWNQQVSGDVMIVTKPYWYFGSGTTGTSHGSPYNYDTNVPLMIMGKRWIKPGAYAEYAEVVDIAPTLSHLLHVRPPSGSEGRVLNEIIKVDAVK
ncbi:putative AlkP superfamily pyrophosphatase or phosphodiesterase [Undibacterium sp. GrIS 1.8]|uniref:alkaline phosphatase family protein n=1 Tax=Undibacterium sp. GrIS 1.8 TaxID=3143934 RepID=UPI0033989BB6